MALLLQLTRSRQRYRCSPQHWLTTRRYDAHARDESISACKRLVCIHHVEPLAIGKAAVQKQVDRKRQLADIGLRLTVRSMRGLILAVAICSGFASPAFGTTDTSTGVCFRRVSGLDKRGLVVNRYETIIVRSSSSVATDIARLRRISGKGSSLSSPDLLANTWIGASITDTAFDETSGEDCSKMPVRKELRP